MPGHVELLIREDPLVFLPRASLDPFSSQPVPMLDVDLMCIPDLALDLVEPREAPMDPLLKPVEVSLDGIPSLRHVNHTTQLVVASKFAEGKFDPTVHFADKDVEQHWSQY